MKKFVALRRSIVRDDIKHLPRPKIVQEVLLIGDRAECQDVIDQAALLPLNQSTDQIHVDLLVTVYDGHRSYNSKEVTKGNGSRFKK